MALQAQRGVSNGVSIPAGQTTVNAVAISPIVANRSVATFFSSTGVQSEAATFVFSFSETHITATSASNGIIATQRFSWNTFM